MRFTAFILCAAILGAEDKADLAVVHRIRAEAFQNSKIMETLFYLTDVNGPRVTNSSGFNSAADWAVGELKSYGLVNVNKEPWGKFGRSWNYSHYEGHMTAPAYSPLIGYPLAWTADGCASEGRCDLCADVDDGGSGQVQGQIARKDRADGAGEGFADVDDAPGSPVDG
jgi:hypothetical protein